MNKDPVPQADQLYLLGKKQISLQASTVLDEVGAKAGDRDINSVTVTVPLAVGNGGIATRATIFLTTFCQTKGDRLTESHSYSTQKSPSLLHSSRALSQYRRSTWVQALITVQSE